MIGEFELIKHYFSGLQDLSSGVVQGIGDDAAILTVPHGQQLVVATDTLVADVHFPAEMTPYHIATRALGVNLSDMAAMGATPKWFSLAITMPHTDSEWLKSFSEGLAQVALSFGAALIGGDTTRGPLTITISVQGLVPDGQALLRAGAQVGDRVFVSGQPGLGALGLAVCTGQIAPSELPLLERARDKFNRPVPRIALGQTLRGIASAAIDVSDGLMADLGHIALASEVGIEIELARLDLLNELQGQVDVNTRMQWVLAGGDDYELCFTVPEHKIVHLYAMLNKKGLTVVQIGKVTSASGVSCIDKTGQQVSVHQHGYKHF